MLISFLVQNKDYGRYLPKCLNSILTQKLQRDKYEILGLDAGSTDNSQQIYQELIGDFIDVTGCNQAEALNIALKMAKGEYIGWINSDDYYKPNYVKTHISLFNKFKHQNITLTFTERLQVREKYEGLLQFKQFPYSAMIVAIKIKNWVNRKNEKRNYNPIKTIQKFFFPSSFSYPPITPKKLNIQNFREECVKNPASMFKKDAITQIGGWNENLTFCIDDDLFLRLAQIGNMVYTPKFTAVCRIHEKNMSALNIHAMELEVKAFYNHHKNAKLGELFIESKLD